MSSAYFVKFVRPVKGHVVPVYGTREAFGAVRRVVESGSKRRVEIDIDTSRVIPLTSEWCTRYSRELSGHLRRGELLKCSEADWEAQVAERGKPSASGERPARTGAKK